jgi:2-polyprenyl-3-methyl-5-hydroxy-6-metoxy-1,4-benzoquinol methylase
MPRVSAETTRAGDAGTGLRAARTSGYEQPRPDVQRRVPHSARRMLDIGCASGALGAAIKARQGAEVVGIEYGPEYAEDAKGRLDDVAVGDARAILTDDGAEERLGTFDCITAADVLEHLTDPYATLDGAVRLLRPGGTVIVSLPNVRFWMTFLYVGILGTWPRRDVGLFDRTHLQWFTRRDAVELLESAGLEVHHVQGTYKLGYWATKLDRLWGPVIKRVPGLRTFFAYQYLLVGRRPG